VAVSDASLGVAIRARHPWLDAPLTSAAIPQALAGAETVCRPDLSGQVHGPMRRTAWIVDAVLGVSWLPWGNLSLDA